MLDSSSFHSVTSYWKYGCSFLQVDYSNLTSFFLAVISTSHSHLKSQIYPALQHNPDESDCMWSSVRQLVFTTTWHRYKPATEQQNENKNNLCYTGPINPSHRAYSLGITTASLGSCHSVLPSLPCFSFIATLLFFPI